MIHVAVLGYGTVGSGVVEVIEKNKEEINKKSGEELNVKYILDLRDFPGDPYEEKIVHDVNLILDDPEVAILCETMGGIRPAYDFSKEALKSWWRTMCRNFCALPGSINAIISLRPVWAAAFRLSARLIIR